MSRRAKPVKAKAAPKGRAPGVRELEKRLAEAIEQRTATSEILRVISSPPADLQPVFDTILSSAARLLRAYSGTLTRLVGDQVELVALTSTDAAGDAVLKAVYPRSRHSEDPHALSIRHRGPLNISDAQTDPRLPEATHAYARARGWHSGVVVPLLRHDEAIGAIGVTRREPGGFTGDEIALLQTFADQAVIAIENARLLSELEQRNEALTQAHAQVSEALEQQTATSEILKVIASSPTDTQPVFDAIAESATVLLRSWSTTVLRLENDTLHVAAAHGGLPGSAHAIRRMFPAPVNHEQFIAEAILGPRVNVIEDVERDGSPMLRENARVRGWRANLVVPMLRKEVAIGLISVSRAEPGPFPPSQIELLKTFADQAVIAVENVRLFTELQASNRELTTALDTQTATSDILRVISRSRTDVQPVFDAIVASAVRLLGAYTGGLTRIAGDQIVLAALTSTDDTGDAVLRSSFPQSLHSEGTHALAVRDRAPVNISDAQTDPRVSEAVHVTARIRGYHSQVAVPMLRHDEAVGAIAVSRREPGGFNDDEIALLQTFADQAVIAIENARLLNELQEKNESLTHAHAQVSEALEQQTATSEILRVISSSPTDLQPVFDTIVAHAVRLCNGQFGTLHRFDGHALDLTAHHNLTDEALGFLRSVYPRPVDPQSYSGRAIQGGHVVQVADIESEPDVPFVARTVGRILRYRGQIVVPMLREGSAVGTLSLARAEPGVFSQSQVALLKTFADQAVIAIENVRLFTELQASNRELTSALDTQTATSDILRVISRSQTDVQAVFDAIVTSAVRLLGAYAGNLTRIAGDQIELAALTSTDDASDAALRALFPRSLQSEGAHARAIRDRMPLNIADAHTDPRLSEAVHASARARGYRSWVVVPLLRHDEAVGTISVSRREPGGFTDDEIALLKTFADQAVIAIENTRLFSELQARTQELTRSVEQLTALSDVGRAVSSSLDLDTVLTTIVGRAVQLSGTDGGTIFEYDEATEEFVPRATLNADADQSAMLRATRLRRGEGAVGQLAVTREPIQIPDIAAEGAYESRLRGALLGAGTRALLAIPLLHEARIVGGLVVSRRRPGAFTPEVVEILRTFATQSALAIQNARLFHEIESKGRELEVASQHKSEFLASMSHELRTPLNAIIGFSDVLLQGMFGETNEKQTEYLRDIHASGQHLLSLINDILDLSKIEAGRMDLDAAAFDLPAAIDDAMLLMRERAGRRGIALERHVDARVGEIHADQRKVKQVLLNLLSNAVKFTPEGGRIDVRAGLANGTAEISVTDTGIGIAPENHDAVFEEFRQVGAADKKAEGTGLGLALCRKFVELHGGRIWVKSQVGAGSTFTFTLPLRR
jgi:GAF domain-containing protein